MEVTTEQANRALANALADVVCETALLNTTLRDLFAAFAIAGIIASDGNPHAIGEKWAAAAAYGMADAMLAQRSALAQKES